MHIYRVATKYLAAGVDNDDKQLLTTKQVSSVYALVVVSTVLFVHICGLPFITISSVCGRILSNPLVLMTSYETRIIEPHQTLVCNKLKFQPW